MNLDPKHSRPVRYLAPKNERMKECQWLDRPPLPPIGGHNFPGCVQGSPGGSVGGRRHLQASREQRARRSGRYQAAHFLRQVQQHPVPAFQFDLYPEPAFHPPAFHPSSPPVTESLAHLSIALALCMYGTFAGTVPYLPNLKASAQITKSVSLKLIKGF
jgi:hypothetical protein